MNLGTRARAERRTLIGAALAGAGVGMSLGAIYLAAGLGERAADHERSRVMADAAARAYDAAYLRSGGAGLEAGQARYGPAPVPAPAASESSTTDAQVARAAPRPTRDLDCLTAAVYYEARGESSQGQFAVAQVVMNRVRHRAFPNSVCGVVFQGAAQRGCQFSFACDGSMRGGREALAWKRARKVAARVLSGAAIAEVGSATHFHTTAVSPTWGPQMRRVAQVGMHVFYRVNPKQPAEGGRAQRAQDVVLISNPEAPAVDLTLTPLVSVTPVEPVAPFPAEAEAADAPAAAQAASGTATEAAALTTPQTVSAGGS